MDKDKFYLFVTKCPPTWTYLDVKKFSKHIKFVENINNCFILHILTKLAQDKVYMKLVGMEHVELHYPSSEEISHAISQSKKRKEHPKTPCSVCGIETIVSCQQCGVPYCGKECQVSDWKTHALDCITPDLCLREFKVTESTSSNKIYNGRENGAADSIVASRQSVSTVHSIIIPKAEFKRYMIFKDLKFAKFTPGNNVEVCILDNSFLKKNQKITIIHNDDVKALDDMQTAINDYVKSIPNAAYIPFVDEVVLAKFTDDVWYRAAVVSDNDPDVCEVLFVDYGNTEMIVYTNIRKIPINFLAPCKTTITQIDKLPHDLHEEAWKALENVLRPFAVVIVPEIKYDDSQNLLLSIPDKIIDNITFLHSYLSA